MGKFKRGELVKFSGGSRVFVILNDKEWDRYWLVLSPRAFSWDFEVDTWRELGEYMEKRPNMRPDKDYDGYPDCALEHVADPDEWSLDNNDQLLVKGVPYA